MGKTGKAERGRSETVVDRVASAVDDVRSGETER
jgi:hypothetical protein